MAKTTPKKSVKTKPDLKINEESKGAHVGVIEDVGRISHGHVLNNTRGMRARCGGLLAHCESCRKEQMIITLLKEMNVSPEEYKSIYPVTR